eukprot:TRINITY_DN1653_c0_g1_i1.p1 TRINITY_DN1653_c0_g1~~TRINITY_DN1653_c0_g1_i1.p1  ORF type:complete len:231 (-),score=51.12 TRINITY_DN1653_c0_g1_i1:32-724(-)
MSSFNEEEDDDMIEDVNENEINENLKKTTLDHLLEIEKQSNFVKLQQEEYVNNCTDIEILENRLKKKTVEYNKLLLDYHSNQSNQRLIKEEILSDIVNNENGHTNFNKKGKYDIKELTLNRQIEILRNKKEQLNLAFKLTTGITFEQIPNDKSFQICFTTFKNGEYSSSHFVNIGFDPEYDSFIVKQHTIPWYVDLNDITDKYLNKNISIFISKLNAAIYNNMNNECIIK